MKVLRDCEIVFKKIARKHKISYGLIFGSYKVGYAFEESDLDIAVKLKKDPKSFREKLRKMSEISLEFEKKLGIETDVIILNDTNIGLKLEIFRTGKILYCENSQELINDKVRAMAEYHDFNFWCSPLYEKLLSGMMHGRK